MLPGGFTRSATARAPWPEHAVAVTHRDDALSLDTLAAGYAELGQMDRAVDAAREAVAVPRRKGDYEQRRRR